MKPWVILVSCLIAISLSGCDYYDSQNEGAAYLQIDSVDFVSGLSGSYEDQNINHVYVFLENKYLGGFPLPCKVPLAASGKQRIAIQAGIYSDGIQNNRVNYPFFRQYLDTLDLQTGRTYRVKPRFTYNAITRQPSLVFENFEQETVRLDSLVSNKGLQKIAYGSDAAAPSGGLFYGKITGEIGKSDLLQVVNKEYFKQDDKTSASYLEFQYKANTNFAVGVLVYDSQNNPFIFRSVYELVLFPKDNWTKVYCDLTDEINSQPVGKSFKIFFRTLTDGSSEQYFALDNVRLITK